MRRTCRLEFRFKSCAFLVGALLHIVLLCHTNFASAQAGLPVPPPEPPSPTGPILPTGPQPVPSEADGGEKGAVPAEEAPRRFSAARNAEEGNIPASESDCKTKAQIAKGACNAMGFLGMEPEQSAMMEMMMGQAMNMVGQIQSSSGGNVGEMCKKQADLSKILAMVSAAKGAACGGAMAMCKSSCKAAAEEAKAASGAAAAAAGGNTGTPPASPYGEFTPIQAEQIFKAAGAICNRYSTNMMMALMQGMNAGASMLQSQQCVDAATVATPPAYTPPPWATPAPYEMPKPPDCSDPTMARTSLVCVCQNDPTNKLCNGGGTPPPLTGGGVVTGSPQTPGRPYSPDTDQTTEGTAVDPALMSTKPSSGSQSIDGSGGGGGGFGGGSGGFGAFGSDGGGNDQRPSNIDKNVITGASSGSGGLFSGGGGGGGGGYGRAGDYGAGSNPAAGFNLRKFLPNSQYKNRGLAGMSLPGTDGVTGPMGPTIWEKVTNQYQLQKPRLLQDR